MKSLKFTVQSLKLRNFLILLFAFLILMPSYAICADKEQAFQFSKNPEIQQVKPKKPVRIKLKRTAKGEYSWDLTGDDVDEILKIDRRLRRALKSE